MTAAALTGVRVLDLGRGIGAGYCGRLLACYGADVVKVEQPASGMPDAGRAVEPAALYLDTGKRSVTLALDRAAGRDVVRDLARAAGVLIEDRGPDEMERYSLDYARLAREHPGLIYVSVSPFGSDGPYAHYQATQLTLYALGGYMALTGDPDREPLMGPGAQPAYLAGAHAFAGVLLALVARDAGMGGQRVEVSEMESVAAAHQWTITRSNYSGMVQQRIGNRYDSGHPIALLPCRDGHVSLGISTDEQSERFFTLIGMPEMSADERFATNVARLANAEEYDALVSPWLLARGKDEIARLCQEVRVPCAPVTEIDELLRHPQHEARGFWQELDHPGAGTLRYPGAPFRMTATPGTITRAPLPGEHTEQVLCDWLGWDAARLRTLRERRLI